MATYLFLFLIFLYKKSLLVNVRWSDSPHCVFFSFVFVSMWSVRVDVLGVTLVGNFIICLRSKVLQNSRYFFVSDDVLFASFFWSYSLLLILNDSDISLYSDPLVYVIYRLSYWASLNCLTVFLETLEVCKRFQLYLVLFLG